MKGRIHYDEKYVKVKRDFCYDLNAVDNVTKFVLAHKFTDERNEQECIDFLSEIKNNCYPQMLERYLSEKHKKVEDRILIKFTCDKFVNYKTAFNKLFYRVCILNFGVSIKYKKHGVKHNNNPVERYNGKIEDRIRIIRGGFGSFEGAENFLNLQRIMHNFLNPHQELREKTPVEMAEIKLKFGRMKLLEMIKFVAKNLRDD